jgi:hypothetical protein
LGGFCPSIVSTASSFEPKLDDPKYVRSLYSRPEEAPAKSKLSWGFSHLDLAIYDAAKPVFMTLKKGWN